jgi:hypothetical protein
MNPVEVFKLLSLYNKWKSINAAKGTVMSKIAQYLHLAVTLFGVLGVPQLAQKWLAEPGHTAIFTILVSISVLLHAILPSIFGGPTPNAQTAAKVSGGILLVLLCFTPCARGQVNNIYAGGGSYSVNASPAVAGTALYAHSLGNSGTYAFTAVDALPSTLKPFTVTSNIGAGVAQRVFTVGTLPVYMPTAAGISWSGTNTGWQWSGGALVGIKVKGNYYLMPSVRFLKSSVSGGTGYQPIFGLLFGWAK